jgi:MFS superfamily sulfate permease-like transporter
VLLNRVFGSDYAALAAAMIVITGIALVLAGFLRLGFITGSRRAALGRI